MRCAYLCLLNFQQPHTLHLQWLQAKMDFRLTDSMEQSENGGSVRANTMCISDRCWRSAFSSGVNIFVLVSEKWKWLSLKVNFHTLFHGIPVIELKKVPKRKKNILISHANPVKHIICKFTINYHSRQAKMSLIACTTGRYLWKFCGIKSNLWEISL